MIANRLLRLLLLSLLTLSLLLSCKKTEQKRMVFSNPLANCTYSGIDSTNRTIHDSINNISFKIGMQWKIHFNDSLMITECLDTIASDQFAQVRTFTITTQKSSLQLYDFFVEELNLMNRDSVGIMEIGQTKIGALPALYVITKTKAGDYPLNNTFFYVQNKNDIVVIQLGISKVENPVEEICRSMPLIRSISFDNHLIAMGKVRMLPAI